MPIPRGMDKIVREAGFKDEAVARQLNLAFAGTRRRKAINIR